MTGSHAAASDRPDRQSRRPRRERRPVEPLPPAFLNLDKPRGVTSHDVVDFVRQLTGDKRVGHCGTLDPRATGVLPLCIGAATRLADHLVAARKSYRAVALLDVTTDTADLDGKVTARFTGAPSREAVDAAVAAFRGATRQQVPLYSAVRVDGARLHERARAGETAVELPVREIRVDSLEVLAYAWPRLELAVTCSKGTYIRQLGRDIGAQLGVGGALDELTRTAVGGLTLRDALAPSALAGAFLRGELPRVPWELAFEGTPLFRLASPTAALHLRQGRPLWTADVLPAPSQPGTSIIVEECGTPLAVVEVTLLAAGWRLQPRKVLS